MKPLLRLALALSSATLLAAQATAQVPDLLNALDAGGRAMAMGGANNATNVDTLASYYNPAALAYLDTRAADLVYRNLPTSRTTLSGSLSDPSLDTDGRRGSNSFTHAGFAVPVRDLFGRGSGTLAASYTVGGTLDDRAAGTGLEDGTFTAQSYTLRRKAKASFYSLSYGKALDSGLSYGLGLVVASQQLSFSESGTESDGTTTLPISNGGSSTGTGVGVLAGVLYTPVSAPSWTLGLSYRSPISLSGNDETSGEYDRIPSRLLFGATWRKEGFREGKDYVLLGGQVQSFFGGESSRFFDRDSQTVFGLGAEYNVGFGFGRVPFRFGFTTVPSGGNEYASRNAFTFGIGIRPNRYPIGLDLSYAVPESGGSDFSIAASYRFK